MDYNPTSAYPPEYNSYYNNDYGFEYNDVYKLDSHFPAPHVPQQPAQHSYGDQYYPQSLYHDSASAFRSLSSVDDQLARIGLRQPSLISNPSLQPQDLQSFIRPYLDQYIRTPNRLAFGERTIIVMSSKVAQKSYGTEKRFLCPPPTAILIGNSWWTNTPSHGGENKSHPPRVLVSISGEPLPSTSNGESSVEWTGSSGKSFDVSDPPTGTTYIGRCVGKQLFISDVDEKKKKVEALVNVKGIAWVEDGITAPHEEERLIGTFPSRPIKVISKPSKKRQSAKNLELCINHGSTISLFHRLRSQTVSTKYLCVSGSGSAFKGSDGQPLFGISTHDNSVRRGTPSFIARTASWDPFILWIVDPNLPPSHSHHGGGEPPPPPHPSYPSPPPNAIPFTNSSTSSNLNGAQIPVYYNQTVVLQCLTSGVVSPVLIVRKVERGTNVVGGGVPTVPNTRRPQGGAGDQYCPPGEVCGDPVSQLHKVGFEVYDPARHNVTTPVGPGETGAFLSCMGEKVNTYRPVEGRAWNSPPPSPPAPNAPLGDYFSGNGMGSEPSSPVTTTTNDGGRVKKEKKARSTGSISSTTSHPKQRRRPSSAGSVSSSTNSGGTSNSFGGGAGATWTVDIGETSVWTIVGTDQVRYNFYVPPVLFDGSGGYGGNGGSVPKKTVTPFPAVVKYLPPDRAVEIPKHHGTFNASQAQKMLTLYGENFSKAEPIHVFFGAEPSPYVEVRCTEVIGCLPPSQSSSSPTPFSNGFGGGFTTNNGGKKPIMLVRSDGVVFPSSVMYP